MFNVLHQSQIPGSIRSIALAPEGDRSTTVNTLTSARGSDCCSPAAKTAC